MGVVDLEGVDAFETDADDGIGVGAATFTAAGAGVAGGGGAGLLPPMLREIVGGGFGASVCSGRSIGAGGGCAGCVR